MNPKLVYRLMREDNLLCARKRKFVVTTDSNHTRRIYPNLAEGLILTAPDQLWRADITYIRPRQEFVFLAVILDAWSRRVIGWALDRTMEGELTLERKACGASGRRPATLGASRAHCQNCVCAWSNGPQAPIAAVSFHQPQGGKAHGVAASDRGDKLNRGIEDVE